MASLLGLFVRNFAVLAVLVVTAACSTPQRSGAAPYAAYVMDARTGETLYAKNADTRLHPASLTKMLTLYIAFEEIQAGRLSLDSLITVSENAASKPPSRLGLKAGQKIPLRYLIRAAAVKSANDAASAIGDAIGGSEARFAQRMNRTAKALGMKNSTFRNANGLTASGHLSTARDMSVLGRRLFYDFPQYYNIFSRRSTDAGLAEVANTNRRFLDAYPGADGIKTGYTAAAGFNLTASAERGNKRIIATVFGGTSTADRNAKVAELLDIGFGKAPANARVKKPAAPAYDPNEAMIVAENDRDAEAEAIADAVEAASGKPERAAKTVRVSMTVKVSPRPRARPSAEPAVPEETLIAAAEAVEAMEGGIAGALAEAIAPPPAETLAAQAVALADGAPEGAVEAEVAAAPSPMEAAPDAATLDAQATLLAAAAAPPVEPSLAPAEPALAPRPRPETAVAEAAPDAAETVVASLESPAPPAETAAPVAELPATVAEVAVADVLPEAAAPTTDGTLQLASAAMVAPAKRAPIFDDTAGPAPAEAAPEVVVTMSTSGGRHWGVNVGRFSSRAEAERALLRTQLAESATLNDSLRKILQKGGGFDANFMGLSQEQADLACRRLQARAITCFTLGP